MAMSMFMGGENNPFEGMFDFNLDSDKNEDNDINETESTKEEV
jgi:hypothetical protein